MEIARFFPRSGHIRTAAWVLTLSAVILSIGFSGLGATINREKVPWETKRVLVGIVSDSMCGTGHATGGHGDRECTRTCVKLGANYALVANRNAYVLKGHESELDEYAGEKVIVAGAVNGNAITVESVAPVSVLHGTRSFDDE